MAVFKSNDKNTSKTVRKQTVIINGKVVSENNPEAKAAMDNMKRELGAMLGKGTTVNVNSASGDIAKYVESQLRMAGISKAATVPEQPRVFECKNCGARNTVNPGVNAICEYCGSGLE